MYPHERSLVEQLADKPFALIGVNSDKDLEKIRETVKEKNLSWRSFQNAGGETPISKEWNVKGWPTIYIIDAEGKIRSSDRRKIDETIEMLLAELGHEVKIEHDH